MQSVRSQLAGKLTWVTLQHRGCALRPPLAHYKRFRRTFAAEAGSASGSRIASSSGRTRSYPTPFRFELRLPLDMMALESSVTVPIVGSSVESHATISLTALERELFALLLAAVRAKGLQCTVRIAGGWVRDKLMGRVSHDIDVVLDTMKGAEFASVLNEYMQTTGGSISSVAVIQANPEQSKHLETATARVLGLSLDFVHLRAETYTGDSRIPNVTLGTPAQDAERRDFTINSLFYNVSVGDHGAIEDFTGHGVADLRQKVLRTPLPAHTTFRDDPLRVLRAVRFASRFGFALEPSVRSAACDPVVHADLATKVSRERYGIEIDGMLSGQGRPAAALRLLHGLGLTGLVFAPVPCILGGHFTVPGYSPDRAATGPALASLLPAHLLAAAGTAVIPNDWPLAGLAMVESTAFLCSLTAAASPAWSWLTQPLLSVPPLPSTEEHAQLTVPPWPEVGFLAAQATSLPEASTDDTSACALSAEERRLLFFAAQLSPLTSLTRITQAKGEAGKAGKGAVPPKSKEEPFVPVVMIESVKRRQKDGSDVHCILAGAMGFLQLVQSTQVEEAHCKEVAGSLLRSTAKEHWRLAILLAAAQAVLPILASPSYRGPSACRAQAQAAASLSLAAALQPFRVLHAKLRDWGLVHASVDSPSSVVHGCWEWKPVVTGAEVLDAFGCRPGPAMGALMDEVMRWQIVHARQGVGAGQGWSKEQAISHLQSVVADAGGLDAWLASKKRY